MSNRHHLPAGQNVHGLSNGGVTGVEMGGNTPGGASRRRPPPTFVPQQYHHHPQQHGQQHGQHGQHGQHMNSMYSGYNHYAQQQYYGMPPQYPNGGMPSPGYMQPYHNYARSPPPMPQYVVPMAGVSVPPNYPRHAPQSPALSTPYQPPSMAAPLPPQTPSSTHSAQMPPPQTPPTPQSKEPASDATPTTVPSPIPSPSSFRAPLPWLSRPDLDFPERRPRARRRKKPMAANGESVTLPADQPGNTTDQTAAPPAEASTNNIAGTSDIDTNADVHKTAPKAPATQSSAAAPSSTGAVDVPAKDPAPVQPEQVEKTAQNAASIVSSTAEAVAPAQGGDAAQQGSQQPSNSADVATAAGQAESGAAEPVASPPVKAAPSSWANLFSKTASNLRARTEGQNGTPATSGAASGDGASTSGATHPSFTRSNSSSLAEAIQAYRVGSEDSVAFLEPRGLINTGNMCYMNSVLQVLMFTVPFYDLLGQVSKRAVHSFKSETPLIDAMIMFMHEFKTLKSGSSAEQLCKTLKNEELEKYGEPFTPEFVYEAIRQLPRFASMIRGHQQDAEEFLGFLLQSLDDECVQVMNNAAKLEDDSAAASAGDDVAKTSDDWLEVGRKQRAAVTRSAGSNASTPITKIFGGLLRSEFRVPGLKDSITTEPYQPLQLDIGSPDIRNVVDALRGLTRPERLQGDFNSPRGKDVSATKQVFIDTLPPILILHLKRFQFDAEGNGTIKIWKKVGYPLELEIPREALSRQKRQTLDERSMPKYRLVSVVYHHGKNASGGHYTVDVRRQDGAEWIRLDDTVIRRVRSENVAESGSEEEPKDARKDASAAPSSAANRFGAINDEDTGDEDGWKQVTGTATGGNKRWSSVLNGAGNGAAKGKPAKDNSKDNRVAYLLFYQRM